MDFTSDHHFLSKKSAVCLIIIFVLMGSGLRFYELGKFGFWTDELLHVIGAKSLLEVGSPIVPGKGVYSRAYPVTFITAMTFKYFGESEVTARLPFVLFNLLFIIVGFILVKQIFNVNIALIFSFVMAFSPLEITVSRECRMYTLFQLLYFTGSMLFIIGFEPDIVNQKRKRIRFFPKLEDAWGLNFLYLLSACIMFLVSVKIHALTYNFIFAVSCYLVVMSAVIFYKKGMRQALLSKYLLSILLICMGILLVILCFPGFLKKGWELATFVPTWADKKRDTGFYRTFFVRHYPFFIYVYLLSIFFTIRQYPKQGIFILSSFVPIVIIHSVVYTGRLSERYIFYIFPFLILGASYFIEMCIKSGWNLINKYRSKQSKMQYIILVFCLMPTFYLVGKPWLGESRSTYDHFNWTNWKSVAEDLRKTPDNSVIISTRIKNVYYYMGKMPDYNVRKSMFEIAQKDVTIGKKKLSINLIMNSDELNQIITKSGEVYFLADKWSYNLPGYLDEDMRAVIERNFFPVNHNGDKSIIILRKRIGRHTSGVGTNFGSKSK